MSGTTCSTCGTSIPSGAERCPGCGAVFGEANRCPHCHAIAAAKPSSKGLVCMACGKPRIGGPGVTVFDNGPAERSRRFSLKRFGLGAALVLGGVVAKIAIAGTLGTIGAAALVAVGLGVVGMSIASGGKQQGASASDERRIQDLAEKQGGILYVSDVATGLHITSDQADALLTSMADGTRVTADVTADGLMVYEFREITERRQATGAPRVRVADPLEERFAELEEELAAQDARAREKSID